MNESQKRAKKVLGLKIYKRMCARCGHDIDWHPGYKKLSEAVCLAIYKDCHGVEHSCPCNKFVPCGTPFKDWEPEWRHLIRTKKKLELKL